VFEHRHGGSSGRGAPVAARRLADANVRPAVTDRRLWDSVVMVLPSGTVTFLFTDIEGSTSLWESAPESMRAALERHDAILHASIEDLAAVQVVAPARDRALGHRPRRPTTWKPARFAFIVARVCSAQALGGR